MKVFVIVVVVDYQLLSLSLSLYCYRLTQILLITTVHDNIKLVYLNRITIN
jgi:hypothetical protein